MSGKKNDIADFLLDAVERDGVACSTVSDGHVLIFKRAKLQEILAQHPNDEKLIIFVERRDFKN